MPIIFAAFYRRMANLFYKNHLVPAPTLKNLVKVCPNILGHRYAKFEEIAYANYVQKRLAQAREPNVLGYLQNRAQTSASMGTRLQQ